MNDFDSQFVHSVFFWLKQPDSQTDRRAFEISLKKFLSHSDFAKTKFIGRPPTASREVVNASFTYSLVVSFDSAESQASYQAEPAHQTFIDESETLWEKVTVFDSMGI
jgi:hypothetical protein